MLTKARITITHNTTTSKTGETIDTSYITIEDAATGIRVMEITMDTLELARGAFRSFAYRPAAIRHMIDRERFRLLGAETERVEVLVDKPDIPWSNREAYRAEIRKRLAEKVAELGAGWRIYTDGLGSRQDERQHRGSAIRYRDPETGDPFMPGSSIAARLERILEACEDEQGIAVGTIQEEARQALIELGEGEA